MRREKVGSVVIVHGNRIVGIVTDRDLALTVALGAATPDSFVSEVMTKEVETIRDTMTMFDVSRYFRTACVKRLPVVNSKDELVGIVSTDDVIAMLSRELYDTCSALEPKLGHMV
jgi:CBS domain-containing protein